MPSTTRGNVFMIFLFVMFIIVPLGILLPIFNVFSLTGQGSKLVLSQIFIFGLAFILYLIITRQKPLQVLRIAPLSLINLLYVVTICIFIQPIMSLLSVLVSIFAPNRVSDLAQYLSQLPFWMTLLILAVTPAIFEEITFRGIVLHEYQFASKKTMIIVNGLFFGLMHMNWNQFAYAFLLGMVFSYFVLTTKSILSSIIGHFVINGGQVVLIYLSAALYDSVEMKEVTITPEIWTYQVIFWGIASIIVAPIVLLLLRGFYRYNKKRAFPVEIPETTTIHEMIDDVSDENSEENESNSFVISLIIVILLYGVMTTWILLREH